jgi:hypothetical protein
MLGFSLLLIDVTEGESLSFNDESHACAEKIRKILAAT